MKKFNKNWLWLVAALIFFIVAFRAGFDALNFALGCSMVLLFECGENARKKKLKTENS